MKQKQARKPGKDPHKYAVMIPENGEMHLEMLNDGIRAMARKLLGANHVDVLQCGKDVRFWMLSVREIGMDRYNAAASRLAQERLYGPVMVVRGDGPSSLFGVSRGAAQKAVSDLTALAGEGIGDV